MEHLSVWIMYRLNVCTLHTFKLIKVWLINIKRREYLGEICIDGSLKPLKCLCWEAGSSSGSREIWNLSHFMGPEGSLPFLQDSFTFDFLSTSIHSTLFYPITFRRSLVRVLYSHLCPGLQVSSPSSACILLFLYVPHGCSHNSFSLICSS